MDDMFYEDKKQSYVKVALWIVKNRFKYKDIHGLSVSDLENAMSYTSALARDNTDLNKELKCYRDRDAKEFEDLVLGTIDKLKAANKSIDSQIKSNLEC